MSTKSTIVYDERGVHLYTDLDDGDASDEMGEHVRHLRLRGAALLAFEAGSGANGSRYVDVTVPVDVWRALVVAAARLDHVAPSPIQAATPDEGTP